MDENKYYVLFVIENNQRKRRYIFSLTFVRISQHSKNMTNVFNFYLWQHKPSINKALILPSQHCSTILIFVQQSFKKKSAFLPNIMLNNKKYIFTKD